MWNCILSQVFAELGGKEPPRSYSILAVFDKTKYTLRMTLVYFRSIELVSWHEQSPWPVRPNGHKAVSKCHYPFVHLLGNPCRHLYGRSYLFKVSDEVWRLFAIATFESFSDDIDFDVEVPSGLGHMLCSFLMCLRVVSHYPQIS